jgi:hypothetical protein
MKTPDSTVAAGGSRQKRRGTILSKVVLGVLLVSSGVGVTPAAADHSLAVTHTPPSGVKAGSDVFLEFRVTGGCENQDQLEHDVTVDPPGSSSIHPIPDVNASAEVSHECGTLESYLGYSNSQGKSEVIAPEAFSEPNDDGSRTLTFRIPGVDVTSGTVWYQLQAWQTHSRSTVTGYAGFWGLCGGNLLPWAWAEGDPVGSDTAYAYYSGTFEVAGSGSTTSKPGGGKPRK